VYLVDVERRGDGRIDDQDHAVFAAECSDGGEIGRLDQRVGGDLRYEAGDAVALLGKELLECGEIEDVGLVKVVLGGRIGELLENRDGVEIEPAELEPAGAAARALQVGGDAEGRGEGVHAAGGEEHVGGGGVLIKTRDVALHVGGGVAVEAFFVLGLVGGEFADAQEVVLGLAGGEEHAAVLEKGLGARRERGVLRKGHAGERGRDGQERGGFTEVDAKLFGGADGRGEPDGVARQAEGAQEVRAGLFGERVHDEAGIAGGHVPGDLGIFFLIADDIAHCGQAGGDAVKTGGNTLAERDVGEHGHGAVKMAQSRTRWQPQG
jgi:hypothetical protein